MKVRLQICLVVTVVALLWVRSCPAQGVSGPASVLLRHKAVAIGAAQASGTRAAWQLPADFKPPLPFRRTTPFPALRERTSNSQWVQHAATRERRDPFMTGTNREVDVARSKRTAERPMPPREVFNPFMPLTTGINVKNYGAVCDGKTDDTMAIQNAYNAAATLMQRQGGAGVVYFPPSTGYCVVSDLFIPSMGYPQGWLTSVFDNGLFVTDSVFPGNNTAFIGRTSNFAALGNSFLWGPTAEWQKPKGSSTNDPVVDLKGVRQVYFEGISFTDATGLVSEVIHGHDDSNRDGVTDLTFRRCSVIGNFVIDTNEPDAAAGFGLQVLNTTISGELTIKNFGMITVRGGYVHNMVMANTGAPNQAGDLEIDDVLSEALDNQDFLVIDTSGGTVADVTLRRVRIADPVTGSAVYMVKHINNSGINWNVNVEFDQIPFNETGNGLIDPSSAPELFSVMCIGSNCNQVLKQAKSTLYVFVGIPPKSPMIVYGSQYVPNPLSVITQ